MTDAANAYDEIPYDSYPYAQSHPNRLATIATLFGMTPAPLDRCRVLELGCAAGGNLLPIAQRFPTSEFLGLDYSARQVAQGQQIVELLGLKNTRLICQDIATASFGQEKFDYIVCHGVWSWVPEGVRRRILELCSELLTPQGVAFVSYNTYPGWHLRGIVRELMAYHCRKFPSGLDRIAHARGLLDFLVRTVPEEKNAYGILLRNEADTLRNKSDSYLAHEHLEDNNHPVYFHEFESQATATGLQYVGEAELRSMTVEGFGPEAGQVLSKVSATVVEYEQYLDFLRNRTFRQTLLCRQGVPIVRKVTPDRVMKLRVASSALAVEPFNVRDSGEAKFRGGHGTLSTPSPLFKAAMKTLTEIWPRSVPVETLAANASAQLTNESVIDASRLRADARTLGANLIDCFSRKFVDLYQSDPGCTNEPGERPLADALVRLQADYGPLVYSRLHLMVNLNEMQRQVARMADGKHTTGQMVDELVQLVNAGKLVVQQSGEKVTDAAVIRSQLGDALQQTLQFLTRQGMLIANEN